MLRETFIFKVVYIPWKQKARELIAMISLLVKNQDNIPKTDNKLSCNLRVVRQSKYEESQTRRKSAYQHFCTSKIAKLNLVSKWINLQTAQECLQITATIFKHAFIVRKHTKRFCGFKSRWQTPGTAWI
jgi:hypothetical protein